MSEPRGAAREARSVAGLRIRPFRHAYNRTVAKRPSEASESVVRTISRPASSFTIIGRAFFASFALQFHPHMIRREVVLVMDVEELTGHGTPGYLMPVAVATGLPDCSIRALSVHYAVPWVLLGSGNQPFGKLLFGCRYTRDLVSARSGRLGPDALKPMDPVSSSRCPYNRGGSSRPALSSGWALKGAMMLLLGEDVASWLPVLLILADS